MKKIIGALLLIFWMSAYPGRMASAQADDYGPDTSARVETSDDRMHFVLVMKTHFCFASPEIRQFPFSFKQTSAAYLRECEFVNRVTNAKNLVICIYAIADLYFDLNIHVTRNKVIPNDLQHPFRVKCIICTRIICSM